MAKLHADVHVYTCPRSDVPWGASIIMRASEIGHGAYLRVGPKCVTLN